MAGFHVQVRLGWKVIVNDWYWLRIRRISGNTYLFVRDMVYRRFGFSLDENPKEIIVH